MIPVKLEQEPGDFNTKVRKPGNDFLRANPNPTAKQQRKKRYWTRCLSHMRHTYNNICAYSASWIPSQGTVDHFIPIASRPDLAYEWSNFRLSMGRLNSFKGNSADVADPMSIQTGWFALDFHNFFIVPGSGLPKEVKRLVIQTIKILRFNSDDTQVDFRFEVVRDYACGDVNLAYLKRRYPFIALELQRQGMTNAIKQTSLSS